MSDTESLIQIVKPKLVDAPAIKELLDYYSKQQIVLPKSLPDICEKIRIFWVARQGDDVIGCVGLQFFWGGLAELRSLAVREGYKGKGIGKQLVEHAIAEAKDFGAKRIFALTYVTDFFIKMGFARIDKELLPQKIWTECVNCCHFPNCDEDAVALDLSAE
ncbi:MAG: N-acetyltransferase [Candidatus Auribacterota bacterium]|nr:N-acetyltransferase [Candidatus Auribacterota bacterium]